MFVPLELVVGGSRDDPALELRDRVVVDYSAQGTRRKDVDREPVNIFRRDGRDSKIPYGPGGVVDVGVGRRHLCSRSRELGTERMADFAHALHGHAAALELRAPEDLAQTSLYSLKDPVGGHR